MNILPAFAGALAGQQQYQDAIQARQQRAQQMQFEQVRAQALQQEMARQAAEQKRQEDIAKGTIAVLAGGNQPQPQAPMPGQSSQPMSRGPQPWQPMDVSVGGNPMQQGQTAPAIPPYRSMAQATQTQQPQGSGLIPEPPKFDWDSAVQKVKAQGITDPQAIVGVLDKYQSRLTTEAQQRLAMAKQNLAEQVQLARLDESKRRNDQTDKRLELLERNTDSQIAARDKRAARLGGSGAGGAGFGGGAGGKPDDGIDTAAWDRIITGHPPPARGGMYNAVMKRIGQIAKENGMTTEALLTASADVKTKIAAKRQFEVRAQNMQRAENQLDLELPVLEKAMSALDVSKYPALAGAQLWALRQAGDPRVTQLDQAAETIFREFEGIVTGNPGTLNVQDVQNAHEAYKAARTPQQMAGAIEGMRRIIGNAKQALNKTRQDILKDMNAGFHPPKPGDGGGEGGGLPQGWSVTVKP